MSGIGASLFAAALTLANVQATGLAAAPPGTRWLLVATCHGGLLPIPIPPAGGEEGDGRRDPPTTGACHAMCLRATDEDGDTAD